MVSTMAISLQRQLCYVQVDSPNIHSNLYCTMVTATIVSSNCQVKIIYWQWPVTQQLMNSVRPPFWIEIKVRKIDLDYVLFVSVFVPFMFYWIYFDVVTYMYLYAKYMYCNFILFQTWDLWTLLFQFLQILNSISLHKSVHQCISL